jgi:hypothetical protein
MKADAVASNSAAGSKGKQRKSAKTDQVVDSGKGAAKKRKSLSSSKVVNPLLVSNAGSSDSESDDSSTSASHAQKRVAKAGAASVAAENKRRLDEEVVRKDKMIAAVSAKLADPGDDGLMTVNELNAMALPNSDLSLFPKVAIHRNTDMGPLVANSLRIIAARPDAAIFHGATTGVVKQLGEGSLVFLAKSVKVNMPPVATSSDSETPSSPSIPVVKDVIVVEVYQLYTPPDLFSSVRLARVLATNARSPVVLPGSSVGSSTVDGLMDPTEFVSVLLGMDSEVYVVALSNWQFLLQMLGSGGFRAWPDVVNGAWIDPFKVKASDGQGNSVGPEFESDHDSSDSEVDDPSHAVGETDKKGVAALGDVCYHSNKLSLTAPSANQISFGTPEQHHLTSVASLALAKRLSKPKKSANSDETSPLTLGKSTNLFKLSYLGMADLVAEAVSYVPSVALNNNINDLASQILDRIRAPICTVLLVHMIKSWSITFHPKSLFNFIPLVVHKGSLNSEIALREFEQFTKVDGDLDTEYLKLITMHRISDISITISMLEIAVQNFLLCIFILWEMRLDLQDEMLRSVQRLFVWLREHSVSSDNSAMIDFCLCACVEFFREWDRFRRHCREVTYEGMSVFLQREGSIIPSLGPQSLISNLYVRFSLTDSSFPLANLISSVSGQDGKVAAISAVPVTVPTDPSARTLRNKAKKLENRNKKAAAALLAAASPIVNKLVGAPRAGVPKAKYGVCARFFSTAGCVYGASCNREHGVVPIKGSADWLSTEEFLKRNHLVPTAAFTQ